MKKYKTPILSSIFNVFGIIVLVAAVIWIGIGIIMAGESRSMLALFPTIGAALMLVLTAMIYFGIAQVIDYLGQTAHSTKLLCNIIETTLVKQMHNIDQRLNSNTPLLVQMGKVSMSAPYSENLSEAVYYYSKDGNQEGPYTAESIRQFCKAGEISSDDQIFREGDSKWRPYNEFPEIAIMPRNQA